MSQVGKEERDKWQEYLKRRRRVGMAAIDEMVDTKQNPQDLVALNYGIAIAPPGEVLTELDAVECAHLSALDAINDNGDDNTSLGSNFLSAWTRNYRVDKINLNRQGRKESVRSAQGIEEPKTRSQAVREFLFGSGGG